MTTNGLGMQDGDTNSFMSWADPFDAVNDWWCCIVFNLTKAFAAGAANDIHFVNKYDDATNFLLVYLDKATGKLKLSHNEGGGAEDVVSAENSWAVDTWYCAVVSCSTTNGQRLIVDNGTPVTAPANTTAISLSADFCLGPYIGSTEGIPGVVRYLAMGNDILTTTEESNLSKGIHPSDVVNLFLFDEGEGNTCNDRGSGADNGQIGMTPAGTPCIWDFTDNPQQNCASLDGINDYLASDAGVMISGDQALAVMVKCKNTQDTALADSILALLRIDANNYLQLFHDSGADGIKITASGSGVAQSVSYTTKPAIGDYRIYVITLTSVGVLCLYINGVLVGTQSGVGAISGAAATAYFGADNTPANYDNNAVIEALQIDGALNGAQVLDFNRSLDKELVLKLGI